MLGLDDRIAAFSDGGSVWIILAVAILLGLRHATDPDHIAAFSTLVASGRDRAARQAGELGLAWGLGHAVTLFAFGLPILLLDGYLPERLQQGAETAVAAVIVYLALRLLVRGRRGAFHVHEHDHDGRGHSHAHVSHGHRHARARLGAFAIGLVRPWSRRRSPSSRSSCSRSSRPSRWSRSRAASAGPSSRGRSRPPSAGSHQASAGSFGFGVWYATAAWSIAPYPF
jgi:ABC-type nickel/cobalt efflux system permease component RcnA